MVNFNLLYLLLLVRWAFLDLTACPFSWGRTVGGEGVRTKINLPNVEKTIGAVVGNYMTCLF